MGWLSAYPAATASAGDAIEDREQVLQKSHRFSDIGKWPRPFISFQVEPAMPACASRPSSLVPLHVDRHDVVQPYARRDRDLEATRGVDRRVDIGEDVRPPTPQLVGLDLVGHLVRRPSQDTVVLPRGLVRRVVRQLVLEEDGAAVLTSSGR
jgi:hypothetical protein